MIYLKGLGKAFGPKVLFENLNLHLRPGEKVGLIGENGAGKSTLFNIVAGVESADSGQVDWKKGIRCGMLTQVLGAPHETVLERAVSGCEIFERVRRERERLEADVKFRDESPDEWGMRLAELEHEYSDMNGYELEADGKKILQGLGFKVDQLEKPLGEFSGGWRMRAELARLLLQRPDLLMLDEPTNHLDLRSTIWLESFLKTYAGAVLLISHDRRFLNSIISRVAELERGCLTLYTGNYDKYEKEKELNAERLESQAINQGKRIAEIERFIERFRSKNTKATLVQSRVKQLAKIERVETVQSTKSVHFRFPQPVRTGRIPIRLENVDKSYDSLSIYKNFSIAMERGWKVALVGENGAGKSTLLKIMAGVLDVNAGTVELGANVERAYYSQHHSEVLDSSHTVLESMEELPSKLTRTQKQSLLGAFLFSGGDVFKKVSILSGGERSRLALARLLANPTPVLFLDEPTNHLDMKTCEILSAALADFDGTLCVISHDRFFLDAIVNHVWEVDNGTVRNYVGSYSDYEWAKAKEEEAADALKAQQVATKPTFSGDNKAKKRQQAEERKNKHQQLKPLKTLLEKAEENMDRLMTEKASLENRLAEPKIYNADQKDKLADLIKRRAEIEKEEARWLEKWEDATQKIESF
ncbi:MAG: ABC transporter ATP-binding protein [Nitrospinae bacterium CG11_big_fil_rev_8_21_14_0_20_45_15]|nr:MAG: ABC transporter ATP-binding protein [Nitrospinae bacterium CG11_big_fil_rev_8_21_14_0_20_45_15]